MMVTEYRIQNTGYRMSRITKAIELLQAGIDVGDKPETDIMQEAIDILSEPTEQENRQSAIGNRK